MHSGRWQSLGRITRCAWDASETSQSIFVKQVAAFISPLATLRSISSVCFRHQGCSVLVCVIAVLFPAWLILFLLRTRPSVGKAPALRHLQAPRQWHPTESVLSAMHRSEIEEFRFAGGGECTAITRLPRTIRPRLVGRCFPSHVSLLGLGCKGGVNERVKVLPATASEMLC